MPPLLQAGFRVLRLDMRGHGGSDPVAGDYTMQQLAGGFLFPQSPNGSLSRKPLARRSFRKGVPGPEPL